MNEEDKKKSIHYYFSLLTNYGKRNVLKVIKNAMINESNKRSESALEHQKIKEFLSEIKGISSWAFPVIIGFIEPITEDDTIKDVRSKCIHSFDYMLADNSLERYLSFEKYEEIREIYSIINKAILYRQKDILEEHIDFILQRP